MDDEIDKTACDLGEYHDGVVAMECLQDYSDEKYRDSRSPWELSGLYRLECFDGAIVWAISLFTEALCYGEFGLMGDSTKELSDYNNGYDERVLAYFAEKGANLRKDRPGRCVLPTIEEAREILARYKVPKKPLRYFSYEAAQNKRRWFEEWKKRGLIEKDDSGSGWHVKTIPEQREEAK